MAARRPSLLAAPRRLLLLAAALALLLIPAARAASRVVSLGQVQYSAQALTTAGQFTQIASTSRAFAALSADGSVTAWGSADAGGDVFALRAQLASNGGVRTLYGNRLAFCAVKNDGSVITWPSTHTWTGGDSSGVRAALSSGVERVFHNEWSFLAVKASGALVAWGDAYYAGALPAGLDTSVPVADVAVGRAAYAVLRTDGSVVAWGRADSGGDTSAVASQLASGVTAVTAAQGGAFAARKSDGSVVVWGSRTAGGDASSVQSQLKSVVEVVATFDAFAARTSGGAVVAWGDSVSGGNLRPAADLVLSGVSKVFATQFAFAALKSDGSVVVWGDPLYGGDADSQTLRDGRKVTAVVATPFAFAALRSDGTVAAWGDPTLGGSLAAVEAGLFESAFVLEKNLTRCMDAARRALVAQNTLEACAQYCATRSWCAYFSFNFDTDPTVEDRCWAYDYTCVRRQIDAGSQHLYRLETALSHGLRVEQGAAAIWGHEIASLHAARWAVLAVSKAGVAFSWGDAQRGGSVRALQLPAATVEGAVGDRAGFALLLK